MLLRLAVIPIALAALPWVTAGEARAQGARPEPAKAESPDAAASAAMERAQRMAANPMRVIMQASKIRRRPGEPEPVSAPVPEPVRPLARAAAPAATAAPAAVARAPAAAPVPAPLPVRQAAAAGRPAPTLPAAAPVVVAAGVATSAAGAAEPLPAELLPSQSAETPAAPVASRSLLAPAAVASATPAPAPPLASMPKPAPQLAPTAAAPVAGTAFTNPGPAAAAGPTGDAAAALVQPKLISMVEPDIPARVILDNPRVTEVVADLFLREDGRVISVSLVSSVPRAWQRYVISALERWRFEPLPSARVHRVQLVFSE